MGANVRWYITDGVNPEPWESPEGSVARAKGGKFYVQMHKPFKLRAFQEDFAESFVDQNPDAILMEGAVRMEVYVWRNVDSSIKANIADATNMQKAIEDALQGILYANDRQVVDVRTRIIAQGKDVQPAIVIATATEDEFPRDTWPTGYPLELLEKKRDASAKHTGKRERDPRTLEPGDSFF